MAEISLINSGIDMIDIDMLRTLDLSVNIVSVQELGEAMKSYVWSDGVFKFSVSPRDVVADQGKYVEHVKLLKNVDTSLPIYIMKSSVDEWMVLDGMDRLTKLVMDGTTEVKVVVVPRSEKYSILKKK